jgi:magnesium chelatase family protein
MVEVLPGTALDVRVIASAVDQFQLSARAYHRVLKLGRTIADLAGSAPVAAAHIAEALQYRRREA